RGPPPRHGPREVPEEDLAASARGHRLAVRREGDQLPAEGVGSLFLTTPEHVPRPGLGARQVPYAHGPVAPGSRQQVADRVEGQPFDADLRVDLEAGSRLEGASG